MTSLMMAELLKECGYALVIMLFVFKFVYSSTDKQSLERSERGLVELKVELFVLCYPAELISFKCSQRPFVPLSRLVYCWATYSTAMLRELAFLEDVAFCFDVCRKPVFSDKMRSSLVEDTSSQRN